MRLRALVNVLSLIREKGEATDKSISAPFL